VFCTNENSDIGDLSTDFIDFFPLTHVYFFIQFFFTDY